MRRSQTRKRNHSGPDLTDGGYHRYSAWEQVTAYFDGAGSVSTRVRTFTLTLYLEFSESYLPKLLQVRDFLNYQVIETSPIKIQRRSERITNYVLTVYAQRDALLVCKKMIPFTFKKEWDLQATIDYLEDRNTGDEAVRRLKVSIESGRRGGLVRDTSIPFNKSEGINMAALIGGRRSSASRAKLKKEQVEE